MSSYVELFFWAIIILLKKNKFAHTLNCSCQIRVCLKIILHSILIYLSTYGTSKASMCYATKYIENNAILINWLVNNYSSCQYDGTELKYLKHKMKIHTIFRSRR